MSISGLWHCTAELSSEAVSCQVYSWIITSFKTYEKHWGCGEKRQKKLGVPIKSRRALLERAINSLHSLLSSYEQVLYCLFSVRIEMLPKAVNDRLGLYGL